MKNKKNRKNKRTIYIMYFMIVIIIATLFVLIKYRKMSIEEDMMYKKWYSYETSTGYYNVIYFEKDKVTYYKASNKNATSTYDYCLKYNYDKKKKNFNLSCNKQISILNVKKDKLELVIDDVRKLFYLNPEDSLNYEFENYFNKSVSEYKSEKEQNLALIEVNSERFIEIVNEKENSTFVFLGDNCLSIDCTIFLDVLEKWISTNDKVYYFDLKKLNDKDIKIINSKINGFLDDMEKYDDIYPTIVTINNNKVLDQYQIKCNGLNCTKYIKY